MNIKHEGITFAEVADRVVTICDTKEDTIITHDNSVIDIPDILIGEGGYSEKGFSALGRQTGFPADFLVKLNESNPQLANKVMRDRIDFYFNNSFSAPFVTRKFLNQICGVVSERYNYFDDCEVIDVLENSPLAKMDYQYTFITPERLHLRAVDKDSRFRLDGDKSDLFFAYFVDNSMTGGASFRVQLGIFRLVCTNGMISAVREFTLCHRIHRGNKDIYEEFNRSILTLAEKQETIKSFLQDMANKKSVIEGMDEENKKLLLSKKLNLGKKETDKILELYTKAYGGKSAWDLGNAVTEFARDLISIERRVFLERQAFELMKAA